MTEKTPAIVASGISKHYKSYSQPSDILKELLLRKNRHRIIKSLNDVSLEVDRGEVVGILGRNGAGKSTLLRIIAGTLDATAGTVVTNGRIAAILELGAGFHPDFTGRENIYIGGMCLGLKRREIDEKIDEIIAFSEIGDFIDQPLKTYSTGMRSRLTFATATSVDPDILIIDEALSVGDAKFQRKSFRRIEEYRERGKTILFVSHDMNAVSVICDRAILLEYGNLVGTGTPKDIIHQYQRLLFGDADPTGRPTRTVAPSAAMPQPAPASEPVPEAPAPAPMEVPAIDAASSVSVTRFGSAEAAIGNVCLFNTANQPVTVVQTGEACRFTMTIACRTDIPTTVPGFVIRTTKGIDVFGMDTQWARLPNIPPCPAGTSATVTLSVVMMLAAGDYFLTVALAKEDGEKLDLQYDALHFRVSSRSRIFSTSIVDLQADISVQVHSR